MESRIKIYTEQYDKLPGRFIRKIEHDLDYIQQKKIPGLCKVYLFGSAARGNVRSTSDIDLLIITKNKIENRELAADIRWTLDESIDGVCTDVVYRHEGAESGTVHFEKELEKDKKLILEVIE